MLNRFMKLLGVAQKPEPTHHVDDKKRKGWYEVCTTRTVCAEGKRNVSAKLTLFLPEREMDWVDGPFGTGGYKVTSAKQLDFDAPEQADQMAERLSKMIPVLQEVAARMKGEQ